MAQNHSSLSLKAAPVLSNFNMTDSIVHSTYFFRLQFLSGISERRQRIPAMSFCRPTDVFKSLRPLLEMV